MIYSLNTKNDDLEYDMEAMRVAYEDKLQKVRENDSHWILNIKSKEILVKWTIF